MKHSYNINLTKVLGTVLNVGLLKKTMFQRLNLSASLGG